MSSARLQVSDGVAALALRRQELERRARELRDEREAMLAALAGTAPATAEQHRRWVALCQARQVVELELELDTMTAEYLEVARRSDALRSATAPAWIQREGRVERWEARRRRDVADLQYRMSSLAERGAARRAELAELLKLVTCTEGVACA